jgi:hypothetical protein
MVQMSERVSGKPAQQTAHRRSTFGVESFVKRACLFRGVCDAIGGLQVDIALERYHVIALFLVASTEIIAIAISSAAECANCPAENQTSTA